MAENLNYIVSSNSVQALSAIANEIEKLSSVTTSSPHLCKNEDVYDKLSELHLKLMNKNRLIRRLKANTNNLVQISKAVFQAKEAETMSLNQRLIIAKSEATLLLTKEQSNEKAYRKFETENQILNRKMENFRKSIKLAYNELQKIRNEPPKETSLPMQLKEIILCCGQYYADYCNEHETRMQVEHRNRFLTSKLNILETEVKSLQKQLYHSNKFNSVRNDYQQVSKDYQSFTKSSHSDHTLGKRLSKSNEKLECKCRECEFSLTSDDDLNRHLLAVKKLLKETDSVIQEMNDVSKEVQAEYLM